MSRRRRAYDMLRASGLFGPFMAFWAVIFNWESVDVLTRKADAIIFRISEDA